jgi:glutaredoxin-related protein
MSVMADYMIKIKFAQFTGYFAKTKINYQVVQITLSYTNGTFLYLNLAQGNISRKQMLFSDTWLYG